MATQTSKRNSEDQETLPARRSGEALTAKNATIIENPMGSTRIHHDVVAKMVGLAVREVEGVHSLVPFSTGQRLSSLARTLGGEEMKDLGVHVEVGQVEAAVDVRLITYYGVPIPAIARALQANVSQRVEEMTGLKVKEINIEIVDLYFEEDNAKQEFPEPARVR